MTVNTNCGCPVTTVGIAHQPWCWKLTQRPEATSDFQQRSEVILALQRIEALLREVLTEIRRAQR